MTKTNEDFFQRHKKLITAFIGLQILPLILIGAGLFGISLWLYFNNDANFHPYKYLIIDGYSQGITEGDKAKWKYGKSNGKLLRELPWIAYDDKTVDLKPLIKKELEDYLAQFPANERPRKLLEKKQNNILLPIEQQYNERFHKPVEFYADYVDKKIKRKNYESDGDYQQAIRQEAWNVGYEYGFLKGEYSGKFGKGTIE